MQCRARADRRVRAVSGSAHHGTGHRKKSLGFVERTLEQKRSVITMVAEEYPVSVVCEVVDCAHSSYYHRPTPSPDAGLQQAIEEVAAAWPRYGYRRITHQLRREGWTVNHKRVERRKRTASRNDGRLPTVPMHLRAIRTWWSSWRSCVQNRCGCRISPTVGCVRSLSIWQR